MLLFPYLLFFSLNVVKISTYISEQEFLSMPDIFHLDNYDKCMLYGKEALYCSITFKLRPADVNNQSTVWKLIEDVSSDVTNYRHDLLRHGLCIPENYPSITEDMYENKTKVQLELNKFYNKKYNNVGLEGEIIKMRCQTEKSPYVTDQYYKLFFILMHLCLKIIFIATIYDQIYGNEKNYETFSLGKICSALSVRRNWQRLMTVKLSSQDVQALSFMQAIRLYIMLTVILCHTGAAHLAGPLTNIFYIEQKTKTKILKLQIDSALSMQTFFMMTSWLLTYHFFVVHENSKKISLGYLVKQFIKRYIRLTPVLAFAVFYSSTAMPHQSRGPVWDDYVGDTFQKCRENWWTNLLYINNVVNVEKMCLTHTWFLATNTQLYILSLVLLYFMWKYQKKIWLILGSVLILHVTYLFYKIYINNWRHMPPAALEAVYNEQFIKWRQWHDLWTSPWSNLAGLVAGLAYGYIFYKLRKKEIGLKKVCIVSCWIIGFCVPLLLAIVDEHVDTDDTFFNTLYGSFKRIIFSFSVGLAMLLMSKVKGRFITWLYESVPMYILGRLTYSVYVIHPILQRVFEGSKRTPSYIGKNVILFQAVGDFITALIAGTILCLFIEMPVMELFNMFSSKPRIT